MLSVVNEITQKITKENLNKKGTIITWHFQVLFFPKSTSFVNACHVMQMLRPKQSDSFNSLLTTCNISELFDIPVTVLKRHKYFFSYLKMKKKVNRNYYNFHLTYSLAFLRFFWWAKVAVAKLACAPLFLPITLLEIHEDLVQPVCVLLFVVFKSPHIFLSLTIVDVEHTHVRFLGKNNICFWWKSVFLLFKM